MKILKTTEKKSRKPTPKENRALPLQLVQNTEPDRTYYLRSTVEGIGSFLSTRVKELYNTLAMTFSLDSMDWSSFKKYIWPTISSGAALLLGDYLTRSMSEYQTGSLEYDFIFKFLFGTAILGYCALNL